MVGYLHCGEQRKGTRILEIQAKQLVLSLILGLEQSVDNFIQTVEPPTYR